MIETIVVSISALVVIWLWVAFICESKAHDHQMRAARSARKSIDTVSDYRAVEFLRSRDDQ